MYPWEVRVPGRWKPPCGTLTVESYHRLGKLRIFKKDRDTMTIHAANVKQFTVTWRSDLPGVVVVGDKVVSRDNIKTFVRFSKAAGDAWRVSQLLHSPATIQIELILPGHVPRGPCCRYSTFRPTVPCSLVQRTSPVRDSR